MGYSQPTVSRVKAEADLPRGSTKREMDLAFQAAVLAAIERGDETCPTTPSTEMGTRHPIVGYVRDD